ncbi:DUF2017 family protein [Cellulomonas bogoriensis]|uniref:Uncharacterized protein n=1 Tax=Cellulomonas bogoriensis 69B4 = DSM 16987 TaxID=1386082 RepID=A0A0A0C1T1_9CELL|nr:DUF2017 family protein [Cellulomonas bogoriensis]KGM13932.1 hypothetical protein N869_07855 [Cellulomonas bogoriensis 69B4 = DSM 16987]
MRAFRKDGGAYVARVDSTERAVLIELVDDVVALLSAHAGAPEPLAHAEDPLQALRMAVEDKPTPQDPALRRLLPDASVDPDVNAEFRRLTEDDLRASKTDSLLRLRAVLQGAQPDVVVLPSEAGRVAAALTDVRLVTSERLGVRNDSDADRLYRLVGSDPLGDHHPEEMRRRFLATVYLVLGMLQESLVDLMLTDLGTPAS